MNSATRGPGSASLAYPSTENDGKSKAASGDACTADDSAGVVSGSEGIGTAGGTGTPGTAGGLGTTGAGPGAAEPHSDSVHAEPGQSGTDDGGLTDAKAGARTTITAGGMDVTGGDAPLQNGNP